jgi:serine/threonine protein kinase
MKKLATAIDTMHDMNISHRDIKFENILLDHAGNPVLLDFGSTGYGPRRTVPACTLSTRSIHLLALEEQDKIIEDNHQRYDGRKVDVWSFSILYLELLLQERVLSTTMYHQTAPVILSYYEKRFPELLERLDSQRIGSSSLRKFLRKTLLSVSPEVQPTIKDFFLI